MSKCPKPYTSRSLPSAIREVRKYRRLIAAYQRTCTKLDAERNVMAKLAADGPCFFNPLEAMEAKRLRDEVLLAQGLAPDGTFLKKAGAA
jgi:hypothetical protein